MKQIKEISLLTHKYAMTSLPSETYKHLLRLSKNWASGKRYEDLSSNEKSWSYQTKNAKYVREFEKLVSLCEEYIKFKSEEPFIFTTDVGDYCLRITFDDDTYINFERSSNLYANGMDGIAEQMLKMIPPEEFVPDSIKKQNTLENNLFELCDYLSDDYLSISILESIMADFHLITRDYESLDKIDEFYIASLSPDDFKNMSFIRVLNILSFAVSQSTMKLASELRDKGLLKTASERLSDFAYEENERLIKEVRKQYLFNVFSDACSSSCIVGFRNKPTIDLNYSIGLISFVKGRHLENITYKFDDWDINIDFELTKKLWNERKITIVEGLRIDGDYHIAITIGGDEYEE